MLLLREVERSEREAERPRSSEAVRGALVVLSARSSLLEEERREARLSALGVTFLELVPVPPARKGGRAPWSEAPD